MDASILDLDEYRARKQGQAPEPPEPKELTALGFRANGKLVEAALRRGGKILRIPFDVATAALILRDLAQAIEHASGVK